MDWTKLYLELYLKDRCLDERNETYVNMSKFELAS